MNDWRYWEPCPECGEDVDSIGWSLPAFGKMSVRRRVPPLPSPELSPCGHSVNAIMDGSVTYPIR